MALFDSAGNSYSLGAPNSMQPPTDTNQSVNKPTNEEPNAFTQKNYNTYNLPTDATGAPLPAGAAPQNASGNPVGMGNPAPSTDTTRSYTLPGSTPAPNSTSTSSVSPTGTSTDEGSDTNEAFVDKEFPTEDPGQAAKDSETEGLSLAQNQIDTLNKTYTDSLSAALAPVEQQNTEDTARERGLNTMMGLSGSGTAASRDAAVGATGASRVASTVATNTQDKVAALSKIYDSIDANAQQAYDLQKQTNDKNTSAQMAAIKTSGLNNLTSIATTMAGTGKTFDDWKNSDQGATEQKIEQQTGMSEYELRNAWNKALPADLQPTIHTSYMDDGKGGTVMRQVSFDPVSKQATSQDYPINAPISSFNDPNAKTVSGANGEIFQLQADGSYKDVSPNSANNQAMAAAKLAEAQNAGSKFIPATKYQQAGYDVGGKFVPLQKFVAADTTNGLGSGKVTDKTTPLDNSASGSILNQTGLSLTAFNYLTQGTGALTRMSATQRNAVMDEAQNFLNKNNLDVSTFQTQYKAYNDSLSQNILRANNTKIMENEVLGTLQNFKSLVDPEDFKTGTTGGFLGLGSKNLSDIRAVNVGKFLGGQTVNDPFVEKYGFQLNQLKSDLSGYFAAGQGASSPTPTTDQEAEKVITDGMSGKSIDALTQSVQASTDKMSQVMQNSVDATRKATWDLFGVGDKFKPQGTTSSGNSLSVTDPSGAVHTFKDQQSLNSFKKAAGLQ